MKIKLSKRKVRFNHALNLAFKPIALEFGLIRIESVEKHKIDFVVTHEEWSCYTLLKRHGKRQNFKNKLIRFYNEIYF